MARETVTLTQTMSDNLTLFAKRLGVSRAEVMRRLFGIGAFCINELFEGKEIISVNPRTKEETRLVITDL